MKRLSIIICLIFVTIVGCANYKVKIMGIDFKDFKGRDWKKVAISIPVSFAIHEFGHWAYGELNGGAYFANGGVMFKDYYNQSYSTQQNFHRAGFLSQLAVGGILTLFPLTRHSDFTFGFNLGTTCGTALYGITGGLNSNNMSDVEQLDNGEVESGIYSGIAGIFTYINLNKE